MSSGSSLVSTDWLDEHLDSDDLIVVEVSSRRSLSPDSVERHIPKARFVYWRDLCWDDIERRFPDIDTLVRRLQAFGVSDGSTIAVVGDPFQYGTYAFWALAMAGFEHQTVLVDGGRQKWLAEGRRLGREATGSAMGRLAMRVGDSTSMIGRDDVVAGLHDSNRLLLDVRSIEEYNGERVSPPWFEFDHGAERAGRIPGARHLHFRDLLNDDGSFLTKDDLAALLDPVMLDKEDAVVYCRLSHRASLVWFALARILDHGEVKVHDGSWTEWGTIVGYPIES
jgi:thiosulfate/3-mercaptopyruvate sulfurtransferase